MLKQYNLIAKHKTANKINLVLFFYFLSFYVFFSNFFLTFTILFFGAFLCIMFHSYRLFSTSIKLKFLSMCVDIVHTSCNFLNFYLLFNFSKTFSGIIKMHLHSIISYFKLLLLFRNVITLRHLSVDYVPIIAFILFQRLFHYFFREIIHCVII